MKIIFCYSSDPNPVAVEAVRRFAPHAEFVETPGLFGYNEALASHWAQDDLVVIEGDKEITADVIPSFQACNEPWCVFEYKTFPPPYTAKVQVGLGCAKFSLACQQQISVDSFCREDFPMRWTCPDCKGAGCWRYLDTRIAMAILSRCITFSPHVHGEIDHHHGKYSSDWAEVRGLTSVSG